MGAVEDARRKASYATPLSAFAAWNLAASLELGF
jgi:hypothetical protein